MERLNVAFTFNTDNRTETQERSKQDATERKRWEWPARDIISAVDMAGISQATNQTDYVTSLTRSKN